MITIKVAFKTADEEYWTLIEKDIDGEADIDRIAVEAAEAVLHAKDIILKKDNMHKNTIKKAKLIKAIVDEYYEPMSHRNSLRDIWRNKVIKVYPISEVTFYRLVEYAIRLDGYVGSGNNRVFRKAAIKNKNNNKQLMLFDDTTRVSKTYSENDA